ncbi:MAG: hypothetical protein GTO63_28885 [Anaerolineae bacterium]|nr:hypothetical protein [Anaerolineae bacterium]NIQ81671.1 hypothetical protein [Anaerolineae bacterium]
MINTQLPATAEQLKLVLTTIIMDAWEFWEDVSESDFCIQHFDSMGECIIFGGTNRIVWRPMTGFKIDASYCTEKFLRNAVKVANKRGINPF